MTTVNQAAALWSVGQEPGRQVVTLGLAAALTAVTLDLLLVGEVSIFFDLCFVALCLGLAVLVRTGDFMIVALLPPLLLIAVFTLLAAVMPETIADEGDNVIQALVSGIALHSAALVAGYALCLGWLVHRLRRADAPQSGAGSDLEAGGVSGSAPHDDGLPL